MSVAQSALYSTFLTALCAWREARGESLEAQRGVIHVILNRSAVPAWWNSHKADAVSTILMPKQFSSFNAGDPNAVKFPTAGDVVFQSILALAVSPGEDNVGGATHYYSVDIPAPSWTTEMTFVVQIGALRFYR